MDVGGTFTDCVAWVDGDVSVAKLSTTPAQELGVVDGSRRLLGEEPATQLIHGTTVATNALLERKGARVALVTDAGFEDVIEIGRQDRPSLYDSFQDRPEPLVGRTSRIGYDGDTAAVRVEIERLSPESVAVSLGYSYLDPSGEASLGEVLGGPVSLSHLVSPEFREFERTSTAVLNAYLEPVVGDYLDRLDTEASSVADRLWVMRSSGGLVGAPEASRLAASLLLSGPAGGVVAAGRMGHHHGYGRVISFDMGGTSTDVCRIEQGAPEVAYERAVEGYVCRLPSVAAHTVGAGGGSLAWVDSGGSLRVGPDSAGASPGPAAYGRGGNRATVTDAHVVLGRIGADVALGGELTLDSGAARVAMEVLAESSGLSTMTAALGVIEVVESHMERAIRVVSIEEGADPRQAVLVAFGGAGGLHASALARQLGMRAAAIPPMGGVFSALGLLMTPPRVDVARSVDPTRPDTARHALVEVKSMAGERFGSDHGKGPERVRCSVDMRYAGQAHEINVAADPIESSETVETRFHSTHAERNGFSRSDYPVEIVTVRAVAEGRAHLDWGDLPTIYDGPAPAPRQRQVWVSDGWMKIPSWRRRQLPAGTELRGPCLVSEAVGTTYLGIGETGLVLADGTIEVTW